VLGPWTGDNVAGAATWIRGTSYDSAAIGHISYDVLEHSMPTIRWLGDRPDQFAFRADQSRQNSLPSGSCMTMWPPAIGGAGS
jgi:hypothetical protein